MWQKLLANTPLANLIFALVVLVGAIAYLAMPRARDPEINFNWVNIWTTYPGASAEDVAREITEPLEDALNSIGDIRYIVSSSREGISSILVRFHRLDERTFDKRLNDVRREVLNQASELPEAAKTPKITDITTSNGFPTAMLALYGPVGGETLRAEVERLKRQLERLTGVDRVLVFGAQEPELHVAFDPWQLAAQGLSPVALADQVRAWFRDLALGRVGTTQKEWLARVAGTTPQAEELAQMPLQVGTKVIPLGAVASVRQGAERARQLVRYRGEPGLLLAVTKKAKANTLALVESLKSFAENVRAPLYAKGLALELVDDQTSETRSAIALMENNALIGLVLVIACVGFFLGFRLAVLVASGMVFALSGTMAGLLAFGQTLNLTVLLGVVIALGMLVDDAIIIVEAIHDKIVQGMPTHQAVLAGLNEIAAPLASAVLTTIAAFLPLMLLPGVLGDFLRIVPLVVTTALTLSLLEAYWLLPSHILSFRHALDTSKSRWALWRERVQRKLRNFYGRWLVRALRYPKRTSAVVLAAFAGAGILLATGAVRIQFFAFDTTRLFYIHADLPVGTPLSETIEVAARLAKAVEDTLSATELRAAVATAGIKFTDVEPLYGDHHAQVIVSLTTQSHPTEDIIAALRAPVERAASPFTASFLTVRGGPPTQRPVNVKIKSDVDAEREAVTALVKTWLAQIPGVRDISDDRAVGRPTVTLRWRGEALAALGLDPISATRTARLLADGEAVGSVRHQGENITVVVKAEPTLYSNIGAWLTLPIVTPTGAGPLEHLAQVSFQESPGVVRRYQTVRVVTVEADLDREVAETRAVNAELMRRWQEVAARYPNTNLDFTGELDDIQENLAKLRQIWLVGVGLIYLILATQFASYVQPLVILVTVPLAFSGVIYGLTLSRLPLSLYTMYGVVALTGIAVNSAIVLVAAANDRRRAGMGVLHAVVYAARRRLIPILLTSGTTIAGLFSLATGLAGKSLLWGPVATSIVWGLGFSTLLTLFVVPLLIRALLATKRSKMQLQPVRH